MPERRLDLEHVWLGHAFGLAQRLEDVLHGDRSVRGDQLGDLLRLVQRRPVRDDVADQSELECFASR